jgi:hypothetical protein
MCATSFPVRTPSTRSGASPYYVYARPTARDDAIACWIHTDARTDCAADVRSIKGWLSSNNSCPTCRREVVDEEEAAGTDARPVSPSAVDVRAREDPAAHLSRLAKCVIVALMLSFALGVWFLFWATGWHPGFRPSVDTRGVTRTSGDSGGGGSGGGSGRTTASRAQCVTSPPLGFSQCSGVAGCGWHAAAAVCLPAHLATALLPAASSSLEDVASGDEGSAGSAAGCGAAGTEQDCVSIGAAAAVRFGLSDEAQASLSVCAWRRAGDGGGGASGSDECVAVPELQYLIARQWCQDQSVAGSANGCGTTSGGACVMVDCPADGSAMYTPRECVLEPTVVFALWCGGRSTQGASLCTEPTEAAAVSTAGCGGGGGSVAGATVPAYGRATVSACRWMEPSSASLSSEEQGGSPRCISNLAAWLAASGR